MWQALAIALSLSTPAMASDACLDRKAVEKGETNPLLQNALLHLDGFEYIRHPLERFEREGKKVCFNALVLNKNIYQYHLFYVQAEVREESGKVIALVPIVFQSASVQGHHNTNQRPWAIVSSDTVLAQFDALSKAFDAKFTIANGSLPTSGEFVAFAKTQSWGKSIDESSFMAMPVPQSNVFVSTWLEEVPGTGGALFTKQYMLKTVLFRLLEDGSLQVDTNISGYQSLLKPLNEALDESLKSDPKDSTLRETRLLELSLRK